MRAAKGLAVDFSRHFRAIVDVKGDTARGEWHFTVFVTSDAMDKTQPANFALGIYTVDFVRAAEGWRIKYFRAHAVFMVPFAKGWADAKQLAH